mgnify:FL=1
MIAFAAGVVVGILVATAYWIAWAWEAMRHE